MATHQFYRNLLDLDGRPVSGASINFYLANSTTNARIYDVSGNPITQPYKTGSDGKIEFYVYDFASSAGYPATQKFKVVWSGATSAGVSVAGEIDSVELFPNIFQVNETGTSTAKNKMISSQQAYNWDEHITLTWEDNIHDLFQVDYTDPVDNTYNKLVSDKFIKDLETLAVSAQTPTIETSGTVGLTFTVGTTGSANVFKWAPSGDFIAVNLPHNLGDKYLIVHSYFIADRSRFVPVKVTPIDENNLRVFSTENEPAKITLIGGRYIPFLWKEIDPYTILFIGEEKALDSLQTFSGLTSSPYMSIYRDYSEEGAPSPIPSGALTIDYQFKFVGASQTGYGIEQQYDMSAEFPTEQALCMTIDWEGNLVVYNTTDDVFYKYSGTTNTLIASTAPPSGYRVVDGYGTRGITTIANSHYAVLQDCPSAARVHYMEFDWSGNIFKKKGLLTWTAGPIPRGMDVDWNTKKIICNIYEFISGAFRDYMFTYDYYTQTGLFDIRKYIRNENGATTPGQYSDGYIDTNLGYYYAYNRATEKLLWWKYTDTDEYPVGTYNFSDGDGGSGIDYNTDTGRLVMFANENPYSQLNIFGSDIEAMNMPVLTDTLSKFQSSGSGPFIGGVHSYNNNRLRYGLRARSTSTSYVSAATLSGASLNTWYYGRIVKMPNNNRINLYLYSGEQKITSNFLASAGIVNFPYDDDFRYLVALQNTVYAPSGQQYGQMKITRFDYSALVPSAAPSAAPPAPPAPSGWQSYTSDAYWAPSGGSTVSWDGDSWEINAFNWLALSAAGIWNVGLRPTQVRVTAQIPWVLAPNKPEFILRDNTNSIVASGNLDWGGIGNFDWWTTTFNVSATNDIDNLRMGNVGGTQMSVSAIDFYIP